MSQPRILVLGGGVGWHSDQLTAAAQRSGCDIRFANYESLRSNVRSSEIQTDANRFRCDAGAVMDFDVVLTRTMPAGSMEQITFRLAILHALTDAGFPVVNPPRALEIAIDKFATLELLAREGYSVPQTCVAQSRGAAMKAFEDLGGDCVVKPLFGGEGRGVMRIRDSQLAWYTFATLEKLGSVFYVQKFVPPGGRDTRFLVIGDQVFAVRRDNPNHFRTNVSVGARTSQHIPSDDEINLAKRAIKTVGLKMGSVDFLDSDDGPVLVEANGIPGWKGAQSVIDENLADCFISCLCRATSDLPRNRNSAARQDQGEGISLRG